MVDGLLLESDWEREFLDWNCWRMEDPNMWEAWEWYC